MIQVPFMIKLYNLFRDKEIDKAEEELFGCCGFKLCGRSYVRGVSEDTELRVKRSYIGEGIGHNSYSIHYSYTNWSIGSLEMNVGPKNSFDIVVNKDEFESLNSIAYVLQILDNSKGLSYEYIDSEVRKYADARGTGITASMMNAIRSGSNDVASTSLWLKICIFDRDRSTYLIYPYKYKGASGYMHLCINGIAERLDYDDMINKAVADMRSEETSDEDIKEFIERYSIDDDVYLYDTSKSIRFRRTEIGLRFMLELAMYYKKIIRVRNVLD